MKEKIGRELTEEELKFVTGGCDDNSGGSNGGGSGGGNDDYDNDNRDDIAADIHR